MYINFFTLRDVMIIKIIYVILESSLRFFYFILIYLIAFYYNENFTGWFIFFWFLFFFMYYGRGMSFCVYLRVNLI